MSQDILAAVMAIKPPSFNSSATVIREAALPKIIMLPADALTPSGQKSLLWPHEVS